MQTHTPRISPICHIFALLFIFIFFSNGFPVRGSTNQQLAFMEGVEPNPSFSSSVMQVFVGWRAWGGEGDGWREESGCVGSEMMGDGWSCC